ncbi:MAG: hypothetical protein AABX24_05030 [Nanoarchaeota archaeon]
MGLGTILLGITGTLVLYTTIDTERRVRIGDVTGHLIADSCKKRIDNQPLTLPVKQSYWPTGIDSYLAIRRYNKVYAALQEKGDTADSRELMNLFKMK